MDWVSDHLQIIIAAAGAVAWWLKQRKDAQDAAAGAPPHEEKTFEDPELAERTRRIREEIQRKIEQRARGYPTEQPRPIQPGPADVPPPVIREVFVEQPASVLPSRAATRQ
jgi:hypothetical protein